MAAQNQGDLFDAYFRRADLDGDGIISGNEAVAFFQGANLSKQVLAQLWLRTVEISLKFRFQIISFPMIVVRGEHQPAETGDELPVFWLTANEKAASVFSFPMIRLFLSYDPSSATKWFFLPSSLALYYGCFTRTDHSPVRYLTTLKLEYILRFAWQSLVNMIYSISLRSSKLL